LGFGHSEARVSISLNSDNENKLIDEYQVFIRYKSKDEKTFTASIGFDLSNDYSDDFEDLGLEEWGIDLTYPISRTPSETAEGVRRHISRRVLDHIKDNPKLTQKVAGSSNVWRPDRSNYGYTFGKNKGLIKKLVDWLDKGSIGTKLDFLVDIGKLDKKIEGGTLVFVNSFLNYFSNSRVDFYMIIGIDNANEINKWLSYETLIERIPFIVVNRKGIKRDLNIDWYTKKPHRYFENDGIIESSSTEARALLSKERYNLKKINKLLDIDVYNYIIENNLYNKEVKKEKEEILGDIRWHAMSDQSFREIRDHKLLIKTEIAIRICNSKNIDHNNIAEMYEEGVLAWAILNDPNYRENYGTEMRNMQ
jgi:hypothetical protein